MTPSLAELVEKIEALYARATPGEWMVYDSCSWRRIGLKDDYRTIIQPCNSSSDNHPDLTGINLQDDLALLISLHNAWPTLRDALERAEGDAGRYRWLRHNPNFMGWEHDFMPNEVDKSVDTAIEAQRGRG